MDLRIDLIDIDKGVFTTAETVLYRRRIDLSSIPLNEITDLKLEFAVVPPLDRPLPAQKQPTCIHLLLHKVLKEQDGMLKYHGPPLRTLPLRVDAGDVVLISSSYFLTHGIKLTTGSKVRDKKKQLSFCNNNIIMIFVGPKSGIMSL